MTPYTIDCGSNHRREQVARWLVGLDLVSPERRELTRSGTEMAAARDVPFRMAAPGETARGTYSETVQLASGRYALVENAQEFTLVPWRPVIERSLGREVIGLITDDGTSWQIGRDRGVSL